MYKEFLEQCRRVMVADEGRTAGRVACCEQLPTTSIPSFYWLVGPEFV